MDEKVAHSVGDRARGVKEWFSHEVYAERFAKYLERCVSSEETGAFHILDFNDMNRIAGLLGLQNSSEHPVLALYFVNTVTSHAAEHHEMSGLKVSGEHAVMTALNAAADIGINGDFNCDYVAGAAIAIDDEHVAAFCMESVDETYVCDACQADEDFFSDGMFSCDHGESTVTVRPHWVMVCRTDQVKDIIWDRGEVHA